MEKKVNTIHLLTLMITTACNRRCPSCSFHIPSRTPQCWEAAHFKTIAPLVGHVTNLCISGGEPLTHPNIKQVVETIAAEFSYDKLVLATNGDLLLRHLDIIEHFDVIRVPLLNENTYPGCPSNIPTIEKLREVCPEGVLLVERPTVHWTAPGQSPRNCANAYTTTIYLDGRVYPCCVPLGPGVRLTANWRGHVQNLPLPCDQCVLSSAEDVRRAQERKVTP